MPICADNDDDGNDRTADACDGAEEVTAACACGTSRGMNDIDGYTFNGKDALGNCVDPFRSLVTQNGEGAGLCVPLQCSNQPRGRPRASGQP